MPRDNVGPVERLLSLVTGVGLSLAALRRSTLLGRSAASAAGVMLIARGVTAYCPVKGAVAGDSSLQEGLREQWSRVRSAPARRIDTLSALYVSELQELHSAETQLGRLLKGLPVTLRNAAFARQMQGYDTEIHSRVEDLAQLLRANGASPHRHADQGMRALLFEIRKVANVGSPGVREAAVLSSLQRVLHFKIAGYGTVATYAKQLGRTEEASQLAGYGDRDKQLDAELSQMAAAVVNPGAEGQQVGSAGGTTGSGATTAGLADTAAAGTRPDTAGAPTARGTGAATDAGGGGGMTGGTDVAGAGAGALGAAGAESVADAGAVPGAVPGLGAGAASRSAAGAAPNTGAAPGVGAVPGAGAGASREPQSGRTH
jgi:ferritin-like metal-binding protein YciE